MPPTSPELPTHVRTHIAEQVAVIHALRENLAQEEEQVVRLSRALVERDRRLEQAAAELRAMTTDMGQLSQTLGTLNADHARVLNSRSWRVTRPLRAVAGWLVGLQR